jgi:hypothetical protein
MENKSFGQKRMGICRKRSQGQRAVVLKEEEKEEEEEEEEKKKKKISAVHRVSKSIGIASIL